MVVSSQVFYWSPGLPSQAEHDAPNGPPMDCQANLLPMTITVNVVFFLSRNKRRQYQQHQQNMKH